MTVSKNQLINGATKFAKNEIVNKIPDKNFKMVISMLVNLLEVKPELADEFLEPMADKDGMYDMDLLENVLCKTLDEYGDFPVIIPAIKFISPSEKELRFNSDDVRKLRNYVMGV
jgi:hypothetical protein